jgi:ribonuclease HI
VARNEVGNILKAWAKSTPSLDHAIAEASAILWAIQLAQSENFHSILVESDSKVCVDAILDVTGYVNWDISSLCNDAETLALNFVSCSFVWVRREANMVAHMMTKFFLPHCLLVTCFVENLLAPVIEA